MLGSLSRSKPSRLTVSMQTSTARSLVYVEASGEYRCLECVLPLRHLRRDDPGFAGLPQPVQALPLVACGGIFLGRAQRAELLAAEEIAIASNDLGALGDLLLADPDRTPLLGAVIQIAAKLGLVLGRRADGGDAHRRSNLAQAA